MNEFDVIYVNDGEAIETPTPDPGFYWRAVTNNGKLVFYSYERIKEPYNCCKSRVKVTL